MSAEDNKALVRQFYESVSRGDLRILETHIAPDFKDHDPSNPTGDAAGVRQSFEMFLRAFPDLRMNVDDLLAEGEKVVARFTLTGTQRGECLGIPATGKPVRVTGIDIIAIRDGKAVEHWGEMDQLGLLQQLGAIPAPGQPQEVAASA